MQRWSVVLPIVFAISIISLFFTPDDAFAVNVDINIPTGSHFPGSPGPTDCTNTLDACYDPEDVIVNQFDTITWNNAAGNPQHTATSGSEGFSTGVFDTGLINGGSSSGPIAMDVIGTHEYYCEIHPWQVGSVTVVGAVNPVSIPVDASAPGFESLGLDCRSTLNACYNPESLVVDQGEIVEWTNDDTIAHTTTSDDGVSWDSGNMPPLATFQLDTSSLSVGEYPYRCSIHPWQRSSITVERPIVYHTIEIPPGASDPGVEDPGNDCRSTPDACYNPDSLTVLQGDRVTWTNNDPTTPMAHTTTSIDGVTLVPNGIWDSGNLFSGGASQSFTLDTTLLPVGNYPYKCTIHPWQRGSLTILDQLNVDPIPEKIQTGTIVVDLQLFVEDLFSPVQLTHNGDETGDVYIVDQPGFIFRADMNGALQVTPFLDISSQVYIPGFFGTGDQNDFDERGLLGLAFHPQYNQAGSPGEGLLYTFHSEAYPVTPVRIPLGASDPGVEDPGNDCRSTPNACYNPDSLTVFQGEIVEWTNDDTIGMGHTTTSIDGVTLNPNGIWDSGTLFNGDSFKLDTSSLSPGNYPYKCTIHPWQRGTLSVVTGPPTNPDFQIPMTEIPDNIVVVTEWQVDPATLGTATVLVNPLTERRLMTVAEPQFNHEGGMLGFSPNELNNLYIALGDGGAADDVADGHTPGIGNAQDESNLLGSILRIDPLCQGGGATSANGQYCIPPTNPNVGVDGLDEIYANGLRNNWRFSWDSMTGVMYGADVGQNKIEEINIITLGSNYGWNEREGTFGFDDATALLDNSLTPVGLTDPVAQYDHDEGISITGGFVYRGTAIPELAGQYVFGDFSTGFFTPDGRLFYLPTTPITEILELQLSSGNPPLGLFLKSFGQDQSGELYILAGTNLGPFANPTTGQKFGQVLKVIPDIGGEPVFCGDPLIPNSNSAVCEGTPSGETCDFFSCDSGFEPSGPALTCQENGEWPNLTCVPVSPPDDELIDLINMLKDEVKEIWDAIQNEVIVLLVDIKEEVINIEEKLDSPEFGLEEIKLEVIEIEQKLDNQKETVSVTVHLDGVNIKKDEVMVLLDTTGSGKLSVVHVAANLPCTAAGQANTPNVLIKAGVAGGALSDVIESAADDTGFVGPQGTCVFHDTVTSMALGHDITDVILINTGKPELLNSGIVVTITGTYE